MNQIEILDMKSTKESRFEQAKVSKKQAIDQLRWSGLRNRKKRMNKNEQSLRNLRSTIKCTNIHKMGVPEGKERKRGQRVLEPMTKHFQM